MHRTRRAAALIAAAAAVTIGLAACSAGDSSSDDQTAASTTTAAASDIAFAQSMIPHHQQAVAMADLALDPARGASEQVRSMAVQIRAAQDPEIEQMTGWLQQWGAPTAMPGAASADQMEGMDHSGHDMGGLAVSGMMSQEQMDLLDGTSGAAFDQMWLQMMVEHHQGAVAMAQQAVTATQDPRVAALADSVIAGQTAEIATMRGLLP